MRTIPALLVAVLISGCAQPTYYRASPSDPAQQAYLECDYEADKATANIRSGLEAGFQKAQIRDRCMAAKGYRR